MCKQNRETQSHNKNMNEIAKTKRAPKRSYMVQYELACNNFNNAVADQVG